jgi:hypothetical protein
MYSQPTEQELSVRLHQLEHGKNNIFALKVISSSPTAAKHGNKVVTSGHSAYFEALPA